MALRAWLVANPFGYVFSTDEAFNGPFGEVTVAHLIEHPDEWVFLGIAECTFSNEPFDPRLYIPSMSFNGNEITHTGTELEIEAARGNVLNAIAAVHDPASATVSAADALTEAVFLAEFEGLADILADADALAA